MHSILQPESTLMLVRSAVKAYFEPLTRRPTLKRGEVQNGFLKKRTLILSLIVMTIILQTSAPAIDARALAKRLSEAAMHPENSKNQNEAKEVLAEAQKKSIRLPPRVVQDAGDRFLEAAKKTPSAYDVASKIAAYQSSLNPEKSKSPTSDGTYPAQLRFSAPKDMEIKNPKEDASTYSEISCVEGQIPPDNLTGARMEKLDKPRVESAYCRHYALRIRPEFASTVGIMLDDLFLKDITIYNSIVVYEGGPVRLENVTFQNCRFDFVQGEPEQELLKRLSSSGTINFTYQPGP